MRIIIAFNPTAGGYSRRKLSKLHAKLTSNGHVVVTIELSELILSPTFDPPDLLILAGGDGTARTLATFLLTSALNIPILIYPMGTVNLISKEIECSKSLVDILRCINLPISARRHYLGTVGSFTFQVCASVGPDSLIVAGVSDRLKRNLGRFSYLVAFVRLILNWRRATLRINIEDEDLLAEAIFVCKGRYYAGPWVLCQLANLTRPDFQVLVLPTARRRDVLRLALAVTLAPSLWDKNWQIRSCDTLTIHSDEHLPVQADGDVIEFLPVTINVSSHEIHYVGQAAQSFLPSCHMSNSRSE